MGTSNGSHSPDPLAHIADQLSDYVGTLHAEVEEAQAALAEAKARYTRAHKTLLTLRGETTAPTPRKPAPVTAPREDNIQKVLAAVTAEPSTIGQIAERADTNSDVARRALIVLREREQVRLVAGGGPAKLHALMPDE